MRPRYLTRVVLAWAAPLAAQTAAPTPITRVDPKIQTQLFAARESAWRSWFANDRGTLERMLPSNFVGIGWDAGPWSNRARTLEGAAQFAAGGGKLVRLEFPRAEIQLFGDVAVIYSEYLVETEMSDRRSTQQGRATEVFHRVNGIWTNPSWHLDSVP